MNCEDLQSQIHKGIPLSRHMDFSVLELSDTHIKVNGGAAENINVHGTAFAGSLYSICTLAAWGLTFSQIPEDTALVLAQGNIHYFRPVIGEIIAECDASPEQLETFLKELELRGKARLDLAVMVASDDKIAVKYNAQLHVRKNS